METGLLLQEMKISKRMSADRENFIQFLNIFRSLSQGNISYFPSPARTGQEKMILFCSIRDLGRLFSDSKIC